jgi:transcriptional regulator with XRE-family HTH domain
LKPKPLEKREARRLRRDHGMPMKRIAVRLGVSLSTVSLWVRDIELEPAHRERNRRQEYAARATTWSDLNRAKRRAYQEEGRARARQDYPLHRAGCMLYWAEGSKERNAVIFSNSDTHMVAFFRRFLIASFDLAPERLGLRLNVYTGNGLSLLQIEAYWLEALGLPRCCLRKHIVNHFPTSSSGRKRNKLPYGVCTLSIYETRIAQHIYGAIQEYAGFKEPRWLDGPTRNPAASGTAAGSVDQ